MMRRALAISVFLYLVLGSGTAARCAEKHTEERITTPQPFYIGTKIFYKGHPKIGHQVYYTYLGFEGDMLKLKYEKYYHFDELVETEILTLPLGSEHDALFITEPIEGETVAESTKLKITVVDGYGRIMVEKIR